MYFGCNRKIKTRYTAFLQIFIKNIYQNIIQRDATMPSLLCTLQSVVVVSICSICNLRLYFPSLKNIISTMELPVKFGIFSGVIMIFDLNIGNLILCNSLFYSFFSFFFLIAYLFLFFLHGFYYYVFLLLLDDFTKEVLTSCKLGNLTREICCTSFIDHLAIYNSII